MAVLPLIAALAAMALIVLVFVFVPLARGGAQRRGSRATFAGAVYRDQLAELTRDRERGIIDAGQEEAARREIERRLLTSGQPAAPITLRPRPGLAIVLGLFTVAVAATFYAALGRPGMPDLPYAARQAERAVAAHQMPRDLDKAVADLEARLKADPNNLDGWVLLGRTEAARQHWQKSAEALRHAMALTKNRADLATAYGEVQIMADGGLVTPRARDAFAAALAQQPKDAQALWYLGLEAVQQRKVGAARDYWRRLLALLPAGGQEHQSVAKALATLDEAEKAAKDAAPPISSDTR